MLEIWRLQFKGGCCLSVGYLSSFPSLVQEWNFERNKSSCSPETTKLGSNKKVWWKCKEGHEWEDVVYKRVRGKPCPYCTNKRILVGYNDLTTLYPKIADEWDTEKNSEIDIWTVAPGSRKKVFWRCTSCGNIWEASICGRTQKDAGCPKCAVEKRRETRHRLALKNNGSLNDPLLLVSWDYEKNYPLTPENVTPQSNQTVWWCCPVCKYSWQAKISNRAHGRGCPNCANKVLIKGKNDLETCNPTLAAQWHPTKNGEMTPSDVFPKSGKKYWWICPNGHEYQASPLHRSAGTNCPKCNMGRQTSFAEQAVFFYIKKIYPDAVNRYKEIFKNGMELDIFIPSRKIAIEYDGVFWHKAKSIKRDQIKYQICKENGIHLIRIRESEELPHNIADEQFHMDDLDDRKNLELLIRYLLDRIDLRSNMWTRKSTLFYSPVSVDLARDEMKIRSYMTELKQSLQELYPDIAAEWHPVRNEKLRPNAFNPYSGFKAWWLCSRCGNEWRTSISHRVSGTKCPVCYRNENRENHPLARKVYQFSLDGVFIKEWKSMSEAGRVLLISNSNISMCTRHLRNSAGGYVWRLTKTFD